MNEIKLFNFGSSETYLDEILEALKQKEEEANV